MQETCLAANLQVSLKDIAKILICFLICKRFTVFLYLFNLRLYLKIYLLHTLTIKADFHKPANTYKEDNTLLYIN
nr:MAG TPA: hypothetical protein [Caudoviricetes sp.]